MVPLQMGFALVCRLQVLRLLFSLSLNLSRTLCWKHSLLSSSSNLT